METKPLGSKPADAATLARDLVDRLEAISASLSHGPDRAVGGRQGSSAAGPGTAALADFTSPRAVLENGAGYVAPFLPAEAALRPLKALLLRVLRVITRDQTVFNSAILESLRGTLLAADGAFRETAAAIDRARSEAATSIARSEAAEGAQRDAEKRVLEGLEKSRTALEDALRVAGSETQKSLEGERRSREEIASRLGIVEKGVDVAREEQERHSNELRDELKTAQDRLRGLGEGLEETRRGLADLRKDSDQIASDSLATQVRVDGLEKDRDRLLSEASSVQLRFESLEKERERIGQEIAADLLKTQLRVDELEMDRDRLGGESSSASQRLDSLEKERDRLAQEIAADLFRTQVRVDVLEKDRDRISDASAATSRMAEGLQASLAALEARLSERSEDLRHLKLEWSTLRSELGTLSGRPSRKGAATPPSAPRADDALRAGIYVDFEEGFRGSEKEIRERQEADAALFRKAPGPVADLGCGRGEFLEALKAAGIPAVGCDANPVMVARAKEKGLKVDKADLFEWLEARKKGSLGGITAYQVVEHLPPARLYELVELSAAKLAPEGVLLFETVNPESAYAMKWFWMDLTHVRPVPAPSLARLLTASGFRDVRIDWRSPVPDSEAPPAELREDKSLGPMMRLLFGPQDYAVIGTK